jgi:hypothetical protein
MSARRAARRRGAAAALARHGSRLLAVLAGLLLVSACSSEPALLRQARKEDLIEGIRAALLESVEAEKSAVLATSDEESRALAQEAQDLEHKIDGLRDELQPLVVADGRPQELAQLDAFDTAWAELKDVDGRLLGLAVANTNLKAARLSARDGATALDRFVDAIIDAEGTSADPAMIRTLSAAAVAALREQSLLLIHIPTAEAEDMERLEQRMGELGDQVTQSLARARAAGVAPEQVAAAASAWQEHQRIATEVVRLSRENSNVRSFDVSVHEKRKVTKECLSALDGLLAAIQANPRAAR